MLDQQLGLPVVVINPGLHGAVFRARHLAHLIHRCVTVAVGMAYVQGVPIGCHIYALAVAGEPCDFGFRHFEVPEQLMAQLTWPIEARSVHLTVDSLGCGLELIERAAIRPHRVGIECIPLATLEHRGPLHRLACHLHGARCGGFVLFADRLQHVITAGGAPELVDGLDAFGQYIETSATHQPGQIAHPADGVEYVNGRHADDLDRPQCLGPGRQRRTADLEQLSCGGGAGGKKTEYIQQEVKSTRAILPVLKIDNGGPERDQVQQKLAQLCVRLVQGGLPTGLLFDSGIVEVQVFDKRRGNPMGSSAGKAIPRRVIQRSLTSQIIGFMAGREYFGRRNLVAIPVFLNPCTVKARLFNRAFIEVDDVGVRRALQLGFDQQPRFILSIRIIEMPIHDV
ncbi:hypothetical protein PFLmoz3_00778 [Pseudomonas fluorescens]|uniref:Uncharacterized protein n=1 Tax=Pseudomonas fluorescens TaxID=294 RepID=A0A109LLH7_PSEFL|nr:hypothetical protein PFLmoz3_00778 [Pseudomonas fluorescens]